MSSIERVGEYLWIGREESFHFCLIVEAYHFCDLLKLVVNLDDPAVLHAEVNAIFALHVVGVEEDGAPIAIGEDAVDYGSYGGLQAALKGLDNVGEVFLFAVVSTSERAGASCRPGDRVGEVI